MSKATLLHIVGLENSNVEPQLKITVAETKEKAPSVTSALVTTGDAIGAGKDCALAIVPVRVKVAKGSGFITTYALLNPGSSATFCTEKLVKRLRAKG